MTDILHRLHCTIRCDSETAASGCHCAAARDEITRLRAENERLTRQFAEHADRTADDTAALRAENERLLKENFSLSAWQCEFADGKTGLVAHEHGGTYCAMAKENERLREELDIWKSVFPDIAPQNVIPDRSLVEQENERLRAANETWASAYHAEYYANERLRIELLTIAGHPELYGTKAPDIARAALDGQPAPSGWRPIDQPPSHPMRVLLFSPEQYDANWSGADYGMRVAYYANGQWRDQGTNHDAFEFDAPTHWMPLPPAPGKEEA